MENPLISILMPAYNVEKYIKQSLESLLNQSYKDLEILVIDDLSIDKTAEIIKSYKDPRINFFSNQEKLGYTRTCNKFFFKCNGQFITFQDADDFSVRNRLELQLEEFKKDSHLGLCGTGAFITTERGEILDQVNKTEHHENILDGIKIHNQFIGATIMIKKEVLKTVGTYREEFAGWGNQDYDWSYRISEVYKCYNIQKPLYYYRQNLLSNSKKILVERAICPQVIQFLGKQREVDGKDFLMTNELYKLNDVVERLKSPFKSDPSLLYRNHALQRVYIRQFHSAFKIAITATKKNTKNLKNYSLFIYIFFRYCVNIVKKMVK